MAQVGTVNRFDGTLDAIAKLREGTVEQMRKQAQADFAEGSMAVIQGKALSDIQKEQPWYNKVFGPSATLAGAEAQTAVGAINQYFLEDSDFLNTDAGRKLSPDEYRARQVDNLKGMLTGNQRVDALITAEVTPKMGALAETHMKAHRAYVNEQNVLHLSNRLLGEAQNVEKLATSNGWDHDLTDEASTTLRESLATKPPGMDEDSWRKMLMESIVVNYKQGSDVMHRQVGELGIEFTPSEQLRILEAQRSHQSTSGAFFSIQAEGEWGRIGKGVDEGAISTMDLYREYGAYAQKYGDHTKRDWASLFRKAEAKQTELFNLNEEANLVLEGRIGEIVGDSAKKRQQAALERAYELIDMQHDLSTDEGQAAAQRDRIRLWGEATGAVQDTALKSQFSYLTDGINTETGTVDPRYLEHFESWVDYANVNPTKALDLISGEDAKVQAEAIKLALDSGVVADIESGVLMVQSQRKRAIDPGYLSSKEFNDAVSDRVEDLGASKWSWFGFQSPQDAAENFSLISGSVQAHAKKLVGRGFTVEAAVQAAGKIFAQNNEVVRNNVIPNDGIPLVNRMGLNASGGTAQDAMDFYMREQGFDTDEYRIEGVQGDSIYVAVLDPENPNYLDGITILSAKSVGMAFENEEVLDDAEAAVRLNVKRAKEKESRIRAQLRRRKQALGIRTGLDDASLDAEIERNRQVTERTREYWLRVIGGGLTIGKNPELLLR